MQTQTISLPPPLQLLLQFLRLVLWLDHLLLWQVLLLFPPAEIDPAVKELNETLISMHHNIVKLLEKAGVKNVCGLYERSSVDTVLQSLGPKEVHCDICKKDFSNRQHLRDHIKGYHFKKTSHYCPKCKKYFTDASSLKVHTRAHDPTQLKFKCSFCNKGFLSKPKLDEHLPTHSDDKPYVCQFCKKKRYKHQKRGQGA